MAHYRVIPFLPQLPADAGLDKVKSAVPAPHQPRPASRSVNWFIPMLIIAIAALCLVSLGLLLLD